MKLYGDPSPQKVKPKLYPTRNIERTCVFTQFCGQKEIRMLLKLDRMRKGIQNIAPKNHNGRRQ